jgi:hypothetical protein
MLGLFYNDMFMSQRAVSVLTQILCRWKKHNNEMASFVVKVWQPLSVLKMLVIQTMPTETEPLLIARFYRLCLHYINGVFAVKNRHEEVDIV